MSSRIGAKRGAQLFDELVVDNFAGGGGASIGIELALGRAVDIAVNHDPEAVAMHRVNHPSTRHYCQDVFAVDPLLATGGRPVGLAWFSPDCTYFSKARGAKPIRDVKRRDLAWVVIRWARAVRPRVIMLENVEEFRGWGPLVEGRPCPERRGQTFQRWISELRGEGYEVQWRELRACDYGAPTVRKRLFLIARCDGKPIAWPEPTHGPGRAVPYRTAAECIDWSLSCPSIFERLRPLAQKTLQRIATGVRRFVLESGQPFAVHLTHWGEEPPIDLDAPAPTVTGANRGETALVSAFAVPRYGERPTQDPRCISLERPLPTVVGTGNGATLVAAFLAKHFGGVVGQRADSPASTVTAKDHHALVEVAIAAQGDHGREVATLVDRLAPGAMLRDAEGRPLVRINGAEFALLDIGMRMLSPRELFACQGFPNGYVIHAGRDDRGHVYTLTKTAQVRLCGNSVCPPVARALLRTNCQDMTVKESVA